MSWDAPDCANTESVATAAKRTESRNALLMSDLPGSGMWGDYTCSRG
jgi:hypothetical protein